MNVAFMARLQKLRLLLGMPLTITSGFRSVQHSIEKAKPKPGIHTLGRAADIAADGRMQYRIAAVAPSLGFLGIGIAKTFIHLDDWDGPPRPNIWLY